VRLVFFGSPQVAVPFLEICAAADGWEMAAVVAQPDREAGRGMKLRSPAVADAAKRLGLTLRQPTKSSEILSVLEEFKPDLCVVVAYGRILKADVLAAAKFGFLNVHFSLLPKFRGAAPVQWSLIEGEAKSGVTLFWLDEGMDTGPIQSLVETPVDPNEDALQLFGRLVDLGKDALGKTLEDIRSGTVRREDQAGEASLASKIKPDFGRISFNMPAITVHNRVRGLRAGPSCFLSLKLEGDRNLRLKVLKTELESAEDSSESSESAPPGSVVRVDANKGILVQLSPGRLWFREVQPEGKKQQSSADFLNGLRLGAGDSLVAIP